MDIILHRKMKYIFLWKNVHKPGGTRYKGGLDGDLGCGLPLRVGEEGEDDV
jgi:hypothetical protein